MSAIARPRRWSLHGTVLALGIGCLVVFLAFGLPAVADSPQMTEVDRSLSSTEAAPNATVQVTITAVFDDPQDFTIDEEVSPDVQALEIVDTDGATTSSVDESTGTISAEFSDRSEVSFVYRVTIPGDASVNDVYTLDGTIEADSTHALGTDEITVSDDPGVAVWFSDVPDQAHPDESVTASVTVENVDNESGETDVTLLADGEEVDATHVSLGAFDQDDVSLSWTPTSDDLGNINLTVTTETHQDSHSISVVEAPFFAVSNIQSPSTVRQYERFDVSVDLENTGGSTDTQNITLTLEDGPVITNESVTLADGEERTLTFEDIQLEQTGFQTLIVSSNDDSADRPINVEATTAERDLSSTVVAPGGTVQVRIEATVDDAQNLTLTETIDPGVAEIDVIDADGASSVDFDAAAGTIEAEFTDRDQIEFVYRMTIDSGVALDSTYELDGSITGEETMPIAGDTITVVDDPGVAVVDIDLSEEIVAGETTLVNVSLENLDDAPATTDITLQIDGTEIATESVSLDAFERTNVAMEWTPSTPGTHQLTIESDTHERSTAVTVLEPAVFEIDSVDIPSQVTQFDPFNGSVTVENTGEVAGEQTVTISLGDGTELASRTVAIDAGQRLTVTFDQLVINTTGTHDLIVSTEDDQHERVIVVNPEIAGIEVDDQLLGVDAEGEPAMFVSSLFADAGWSVVAVDDADGTILGVTDLDREYEGERLVVPLSGVGDGGIDVTAYVVTNGDPTVGDSLSADVIRLASGTGTIFSASIEVSSLVYEDETDQLHIDSATVHGGSATQPFTIAAYAQTGTMLGSVTLGEGHHESIQLPLDTPLPVGAYELTLRLHAADLGEPGAVYEQVDGTDIVPNEVSFFVDVIETPQFVIQSVDHPEVITQGQRVDLAVTIHNEGNVGGTQTLWIEHGDRVSLIDVTLGANETTTVHHSIHLDRSTLGDVEIDLEVGDSTETITVTVEPREEDDGADTIPGFTIVLTLGALIALAVAARRLV